MAKWWQERVVYQIYPRSFADSNGDGIGDIPGMIAHLDDLADLGVGILWLSPIYPSPNADNGYDISDYRAIHPEYGTMADMERLIAEAGKRDIKIILDLVINHTSDEHEWFQKSRDAESEYRDYYIWRSGKVDGKGKRRPPNNWTSFFGEGCWEYDDRSKEYYLHLFAKKQPDLNHHNPKVIAEIKDIMRFWLNKGVAGFRCDVINVIYKSSLQNGKKRLALTGREHYISQPGAHEILRELRKDALSEYDCFAVGETVFVTPQMGKELCDEKRGELDMIFSFEHMETDQFFVKWFKRRFDAQKFGRTLAKWQGALEWCANYLENHDQPRSVSRFGDDGTYWAESAKMLCTLLFTLRGTPFVFEGQEIGMTNFDYTSIAQLQDVESHNIDRLAKSLGLTKRMRWRMMQQSSRDNARTPMQWTDGQNGGFSAGTPWLAVNANHERINVAAQKNDPGSIRSYYKAMIALRAQTDVLKWGSFEPVSFGRRVMVFRRVLDGSTVTVALNFSQKTQKFGHSGQVLIDNYEKKVFDRVLEPYEAVVLLE